MKQISGGKEWDDENEKRLGEGVEGDDNGEESRKTGSSDSFVRSAITFPSIRHQYAEGDRDRTKGPLSDNDHNNDHDTKNATSADGDELKKEHLNVQERDQVAESDNISEGDENGSTSASSRNEDRNTQSDKNRNKDRGEWGKRRDKKDKSAKENKVEEREEKGRWRRKSKISSDSRGKKENKDKDKEGLSSTADVPPVMSTSTSTPETELDKNGAFLS